MLGWIRNARVDGKTALVVLLVALAIWAAVVYVNVRDFVPEELIQPTGDPC